MNTRKLVREIAKKSKECSTGGGPVLHVFGDLSMHLAVLPGLVRRELQCGGYEVPVFTICWPHTIAEIEFLVKNAPR